MSYLVIVAAIAVVPLYLGYRWGGPIYTWSTARPPRGAFAIIGGAVLWFVLAYFSRIYADSDGRGWGLAEWCAHRGKWYVYACAMLFMLGAHFQSGVSRQRIATTLAIEVFVIWIMVWRTMPIYVWLPRGPSQAFDGVLRQRIEYTCVPICLGNLLEESYGRMAPTERELARLTRTTIEGTPLRGLIAAAATQGLALDACRVMRLDELRGYNAPAVVQISTISTVRHATLVTRVGEDEVELIDPAYGHRRLSLARFESIWYGKTTVFKPLRP